MMSESVTVTVQNGQDAARPGAANKNLNFTLNTPYFRSIPGLIKIAQLEGIENEGEKIISEEETLVRERRRTEWEKVNSFLNSRVEEVIEAISFNAEVNLHRNDASNLAEGVTTPAMLATCTHEEYHEKVSLLDLKTIKDRELFSASWHPELNDIILCSYLARDSLGPALITVWSILSPLRPKIILNCDEMISAVSFCPMTSYTNVIVGGSLDGKITVWETDKSWFLQPKEIKDHVSLDELAEPPMKEAKLATSGAKGHKLSVVGIEWLPSWIRIKADGNFERVSSDRSKPPKPYFASGSVDGSIYFWGLPRYLSSPAEARSPLQLTIGPTYKLSLEDPDEKLAVNRGIKITCFNFTLARSEESFTADVFNDSDLERMRKVFVGTATGEVMCCTWEGQLLKVSVTNHESCSILTRSCVHDGIVRTMAKSPNLDDVFLTVGGRIFAIWKVDYPRAPIFYKRSKTCRYAGGCWSSRSGMFILTRLDGCIELWDLKEKCHEPVLLQTLSHKILGIICMACGSPGYNAGHWFLFVAVTAFIMSLIWSLVYLLSIRETFKIPINWLLTELLNTAIYTLLYFTAFVTELAWAFWVPYIIAGVFGIFNTIAYAAGAYFLYLEYKNNQ